MTFLAFDTSQLFLRYISSTDTSRIKLFHISLPL